MILLLVIHGYPMRYNAGSEVYTQQLAHELSKYHEVHVFTREENSFLPDFSLRKEVDLDNPKVTLHIVNNPRMKDRYQVDEIDNRFSDVLKEVGPDIIHIGHLNHLSTSLVERGALHSIPIIFTLHDYWLMCPRGQFIQMFSDNKNEPWSVCSSQDDEKCATHCYARYFGGNAKEMENDVAYWTRWVQKRIEHIKYITTLVDSFIAPSQYLKNRFVDNFDIPQSKINYIDYGFSLDRFKNRTRDAEKTFVFGYIGTHIPAKGIHHLIESVSHLKGDFELKIWGKHRGQETEALKSLVANIPHEFVNCITWYSEYRNQEIVTDVFNYVDAIVVPSIWVENSPLVIHEAQQAHIPVITANVGGMAEYVKHEVNGLLFSHRSIQDLTHQMQRFIDNPQWAQTLGKRGYIKSQDGSIPTIEKHIKQIEALYNNAIATRNSAVVQKSAVPWRITFDTNPDSCNFNCIMCEQHSQFNKSIHQIKARNMSIGVISNVIKELSPIGLREIIPSTMGEPLLYKEFEAIIDLVRQYGITLNLTTNGSFPRLGAYKWAQKIVPIASDVKISWNGSKKETHEKIMVGSSWAESLENIKTFISVRDEYAAQHQHRCRVTLQVTFMESNYRELPDIVKLAIELGVDRVKGHHLWTHFPEIRQESIRRSSDSIKRWNDIVRQTRDVAKKYMLTSDKQIVLTNIDILSESAVENLAPQGFCPFLGQEAWINTEGRFDVCCAPDEQRQKLGYFGNIHENDFMTLWQSEKYDSLLKTYRTHPLCLSCNMKQQSLQTISEKKLYNNYKG